MADLDHRTVEAPYLRLTEEHATPGGDTVAIWHFRVEQPNVQPVETAVMHSLEHGLIYGLRQRDRMAILAAPMGCGTGLYLTAINITEYDVMAPLVADVLTWICNLDAVPWADEVHCGMAAEHDLPGVRAYAWGLLERQREWGSPGANAREIGAEVGTE
jgi:S-ribosylhomocysteine lyase